MRSARSWAASRRQQRLHSGGRKLRLRCLRTQAAAAHAHSTQPANGLQRAEVLPMLPLAVQLVQPPLRANLPNAGVVRGGEHGSFTRGDEASSSMKGCSPCMYLRCVRATSHVARDILSTLPARRADLRGFTRSVTRMYRLCSNASCVTHRVLTGTRPRSVTVSPSRRHGRALPHAAVEGTGVQSVARHLEVPKKVPT